MATTKKKPTTALGAGADKAGGTVATGGMTKVATPPPAPAAPAKPVVAQKGEMGGFAPVVTTPTVTVPTTALGAGADKAGGSVVTSPTPPVAPVVTEPATSGTSTPGISQDTRDAFTLLKDTLTGWGLGSLSDTLDTLMREGNSAPQALVKIKYDKNYNAAYLKRFAGNVKRVEQGLNALSEGDYITNENSYAETLKAYGLGNMLTTNREENEKQFATYIANDVSPVEFKDRIKTASDAVLNADPAVMDTFKKFYGTLTTSDIVAYFLNPKDTLPKLKTKAAAADIGTAASNAGFYSKDLAAEQVRAEQLAGMGYTAADARTGYANIAELLPTSTKLGDIYGDKFDLKQAEQEQFSLEGGSEAAAKRRRLKSMERAQFSGDAGVTSGVSLSQATFGR